MSIYLANVPLDSFINGTLAFELFRSQANVFLLSFLGLMFCFLSRIHAYERASASTTLPER